MADLHRAAPGRVAGARIEPADIGDPQPIAAQAIARPDPHLAGRPVDSQDEPALGGGGQSAPLPDGEAMRAGVRAERRPGLVVDDRAGRPAAAAGVEKGDVVAVGDEADLLRVGLVGVGEAEPARQRAHLVLRLVAEREAHPRQDLRPDAEQEVRLILVGVARAAQRHAAVIAVASGRRGARSDRSPARWRRPRRRTTAAART